MENVLLIGNDINNTNHGKSWNDLLGELKTWSGQGNHLTEDEEKVPSSLIYERIALTTLKSKNKQISESGLKQKIATWANNIAPTNIHRELAQISGSHILTTNYDLSLEKALNKNFAEKNCTNKGLIKEQKYSIFRHFEVEGKKVWHLHGSLDKPNSINLGYEHYSGYLQAMRNYVATSPQYTKSINGNRSLIHNLKNKDEFKVLSWLNLFFTQNIHILGLGLNFVEMHLWWLLTYRARKRFLLGSDFIKNSITYYYPKCFESCSNTGQKIQLLKACDVITKPVDGGIPANKDDKYCRETYYQNLVKLLRK
ncbi:MAG: SIR2 family protein [Opitutales bacterium]|nr:SIR2 family protein [Opitutales bacterium]